MRLNFKIHDNFGDFHTLKYIFAPLEMFKVKLTLWTPNYINWNENILADRITIWHLELFYFRYSKRR